MTLLDLIYFVYFSVNRLHNLLFSAKTMHYIAKSIWAPHLFTPMWVFPKLFFGGEVHDFLEGPHAVGLIFPSTGTKWLIQVACLQWSFTSPTASFKIYWKAIPEEWRQLSQQREQTPQWDVQQMYMGVMVRHPPTFIFENSLGKKGLWLGIGDISQFETFCLSKWFLTDYTRLSIKWWSPACKIRTKLRCCIWCVSKLVGFFFHLSSWDNHSQMIFKILMPTREFFIINSGQKNRKFSATRLLLLKTMSQYLYVHFGHRYFTLQSV